jgi:hypothetical protein
LPATLQSSGSNSTGKFAAKYVPRSAVFIRVFGERAEVGIGSSGATDAHSENAAFCDGHAQRARLHFRRRRGFRDYFAVFSDFKALSGRKLRIRPPRRGSNSQTVPARGSGEPVGQPLQDA